MVSHSQPVAVPVPESGAKRIERKKEVEIPRPARKPRFSITVTGHVPC